jgi:ubiquinone/menaquinone biosynthesis C-methylase UbiE
MTFLLLAVVGLTAALLYWELVICEAAHLGAGPVVWLYDRASRRYDGIKSFDWDWERRFLGEPVRSVVGELPSPRLLDVGAGTGRVARATNDAGGLEGLLVCLEPSRKMMELGRRLAPFGWSRWTRGWADHLPFATETFDLVTMIEVVEFTPSPDGSLRECVRVLQPGGWLLISNRIGRAARMMLGKASRPERLRQKLESLGLTEIETFPWQVEYDLLWARKPWPAEQRPER